MVLHRVTSHGQSSCPALGYECKQQKISPLPRYLGFPADSASNVSRADNKPSRSLKFYNCKEGSYLRKAPTSAFTYDTILAHFSILYQWTMEGYNGFTSWIEDDCPDNFLKLFSISFLQLLCVKISHWLTVLEHKILFKSAGSRFGLVNVVHLCTHASDNRKSFWNQRENLHSTFQCCVTFLVLFSLILSSQSSPKYINSSLIFSIAGLWSLTLR